MHSCQAAISGSRKFNVLDKKEKKIAKKFKIVLAEKPSLQEAAERSRNRQHFSCCCCCRSHINLHNQVRGHRTGSSDSGAEEYPREKHTQPEYTSLLGAAKGNRFVRGGSFGETPAMAHAHLFFSVKVLLSL